MRSKKCYINENLEMFKMLVTLGQGGDMEIRVKIRAEDQPQGEQGP